MQSPASRVSAQLRCCRSLSVSVGGPQGAVRSFEDIPSTGSSGWVTLLRYWKNKTFSSLHTHMESTFNTLGPIYRERLGSQECVNILLPGDIGELFRAEGLHPRRMLLQPWAAHREARRHSKGVFLKNGAEWRADRLLLNREVMAPAAVMRFLPQLAEVAGDFASRLRGRVEREGRGAQLTLDLSPDLFRYALESICMVLYGERIGLLSDPPSPEAQRFIWAVERMLETTSPLLYLPPPLLPLLAGPLWREHLAAWDHIFTHADTRIQRGYQRLKMGGGGGHYQGVLGELLGGGQLSLELIKANITELMVGGVDTTAVPLQFALFELARNPGVQEAVRAQAQGSYARAGGHAAQTLQGVPLLKGTVKETLRLYPVGITVQRYPIRDVVLQNYHIPAGTLVQACLYPLGHSERVFPDPARFDPGRWAGGYGATAGDGTRGDGSAFRSLAFGFGARQCVGRRIAENEMQLLLLHILLNFRLDVSSRADIDTKYTLILQPKRPPLITFTLL
ncbi:cytochrome P450 11C1 [Amia ocellicauda]|uniref:cytochrome P450 11C1 n=1 Tax=Amia ocellicauda TaxID=2972642 RepID=UPI003463DE22